MIFWGAQNIAGERSLKIPYSTIAVKNELSSSSLSLSIDMSCQASSTVLEVQLVAGPTVAALLVGLLHTFHFQER